MRERTMTSLDYHRMQRAAERTDDYKARRLQFYVVEAPDGTRLAGPTETRERAEWLQARVGGEIRYVDNSPKPPTPAAVLFADGCGSWLTYRHRDQAEAALADMLARGVEIFEGGYVVDTTYVRLDVVGCRRISFDTSTGLPIRDRRRCPDHRPKA